MILGEKEEDTMKSQEQYLTELQQWLTDTADEPLEEMAGFFTSRLGDYEQHMAVWEKIVSHVCRVIACYVPPYTGSGLRNRAGTGSDLGKVSADRSDRR